MRLLPTNDGFLLETSAGASINLTEEEALELPQLAHQIQDHIRSRRPRTFPVRTYEANEITVGLDAHHTLVLLRMRGPDGLEVSYHLSLDTAKSTRDSLTRKVEQIESAQQNRTTQ
jgi:hypothetical protein